MSRLLGAIFVLLGASLCFSQIDAQPLVETQLRFDQAASIRGMKVALLAFLSDDAIVFEPGAVNGRKYWASRVADPSAQLVRSATYCDIAANGLLGYTTGNWRIYKKGKPEEAATFGQYVTIWEK